MKKLLIIAVVALAGFTCNKDSINPDSIEYVVFGTAFGHCAGDCSSFFKIEKEKIYADNISRYSGEGSVTFNATPLSNDKYMLAKELIDNFPEYLINNKNKTFGCPDCADQGGVHIEIKKDGQLFFWHIDTNASNQPAEIRPYIERMRELLGQL